MKGIKNNEMTKDEYYMTIARIAGMHYDGHPHAATCIVDKDDRIVSIGAEIASGNLPSSGRADTDMRLYTFLFPDRDLASRIIQSDIHTVIYDEDGVSDSLSSIKIKNSFKSAGITCRKYHRSGKNLAFAI